MAVLRTNKVRRVMFSVSAPNEYTTWLAELRRWCVAWDAGPFGVSVDSRHLTPIDAYVWKLVGSCGYPGYYVTTIKKARAESQARQEAADCWLRLVRTERRPLVE